MSTAKKTLEAAALVTIVKAFLYMLDSKASFFLGDSQGYLTTALTKWFPPDRSFVYGYIIRVFCVRHFHRLDALVVLQTLLGGLSSVILAWCLLRFFRATFSVALAAAALYAVEPLQWLSEHYILTEAVSSFLLALLLWLSFAYLERPRIWKLLVQAPLAFALVSIRMSNLPLILTVATSLPVLGWLALERRAQRTALIILGLSLPVSLGCVQAALYSFGQFNAARGKRPAALNYADGFFLAADFAPILQFGDFPDADTGKNIFASLTFPLQDRQTRLSQRWTSGGLIRNVIAQTPDYSGYGDHFIANQRCRTMALRALRRNPAGALKLALFTFGDYWRLEAVRSSLTENMGVGRALPTEFTAELAWFGYRYSPADYPSTISKRWAAAAYPWYYVLLLSPFFFIISLPLMPRGVRPYWILLFIESLVFVSMACIFVEKPTVRYLQPLSWLVILGIGALAHSIRSRNSRHSPDRIQ